MLDVLDNPSFINPWALPTMTTQVLQGLIQPVPQLRGARPKEMVQPKSNRGVPSNWSEVSGMTDLIKPDKTTAPSKVTLVGPSVSRWEIPPLWNKDQMYMSIMKGDTPKGPTNKNLQVIQQVLHKR